eukprot:1766619-Pleurochrysis_carterae.AAC.1
MLGTTAATHASPLGQVLAPDALPPPRTDDARRLGSDVPEQVAERQEHENLRVMRAEMGARFLTAGANSAARATATPDAAQHLEYMRDAAQRR